eukprot:1137369-Pelagomonas_calceolata.AAC.3
MYVPQQYLIGGANLPSLQSSLSPHMGSSATLYIKTCRELGARKKQAPLQGGSKSADLCCSEKACPLEEEKYTHVFWHKNDTLASSVCAFSLKHCSGKGRYGIGNEQTCSMIALNLSHCPAIQVICRSIFCTVHGILAS